MLAVETIAKIRRKILGEGKSIRGTARELGISRNTVRRVVRDGKAEHRYDRSDKQPRPKLDGFTQLLETELENNAKADPARSPDAQGDLAPALRPGLRGRLRRRASLCPAVGGQPGWQHCGCLRAAGIRSRRGLSVRLEPRDGVAGRHADDGQGRAVHPVLQPHAVHPLLSAETQEMVFDAHDRAFAAFGGTCGRGIYDNMTTAVERVLIGKDRQINPRFAAMCGHHLVDPVFLQPQGGP